MEFSEKRAAARGVRQGYAAMKERGYGRTWTAEEVMLGFLGNVGNLAKLVRGKAGPRPRPQGCS